jgi:type IX secretion system substrate protein
MKFNYLIKSVIVCCALLTSKTSNAQVSGANVFLQGKYVELGMGKLGYFGSDTVAAPAGYHPHCSPTPGMGFVADWGMDGWTTGTPPFMGDYFLPGNPFEGWELQVDTMRVQAFHIIPNAFVYSAGMPAVTGVTFSYSTTGSTSVATWQGTVDSIILTQVTTVDTSNLYFTVDVTLTNTAYAPKNNIYYLRAIDPDNDETWPGGGFATTNKIEHQVTDSTVVSARGLIYPTQSYMSLGTTDTTATCFISTVYGMAIDTDLTSIYNRTSSFADYTQGDSMMADGGIGLVIKVAHLATVDSAGDSVARETAIARKHPANKASFSFFYSFGPAATDSAISAGIKKQLADTAATPSGSGLGVKNINSVNDVKVYPNPASNIINISGLNSGDQVSVFDMMGRKVVQNTVQNGTGLQSISLSNITAGAYILVVNDVNGNVKARVPVRKI